MNLLVLLLDTFESRGGIATFNRHLLRSVNRQKKFGHITIIPRRGPVSTDPLPGKITQIETAMKGKLAFAITTFLAIFKMRYDIILCGHINLLPIAALLKKITGAKLWMVIHGKDAWKPPASGWKTNLHKNIDSVFSVSELTKERFLSWAPLAKEKVYILPNAVDLDNFHPGEKPPHLLHKYGLEGKKVIMIMSRLDRPEDLKGHDEILEVLPDLLQEFDNLVFVIAGVGDDRERLEIKVKSLGLEKRVIFTGWIPENEKNNYYLLADLFAMPSQCEGFGIVYIEAMACGIPTLASALDGGMEALIGGKLGIIVDPRDPEKLKEGIRKGLQMPRGHVHKELQHFSLMSFNDRVNSFINKLTN